jgi:hypothetical protein
LDYSRLFLTILACKTYPKPTPFERSQIGRL